MDYRVPYLQAGQLQFSNNVIYNSAQNSLVSTVGGVSNAEFVNNYYFNGPQSYNGTDFPGIFGIVSRPNLLS
jgi:hypothetical protein